MKIDKLLHFLVGFLIAAILTALLGPIAGIIIAFLIGAGKEIVWDYYLKKGTPELNDFVATGIGIVLWIWTYLWL